MRTWSLLAVCGLGSCLATIEHALGQSPPTATPKVVPATRSETKELLEALKLRTPRLPVPDAPSTSGAPSDKPATVINGRSRNFYLLEAWLKADRFGNEPNALVDYPLKTQCFWIASRGNNCHYCLGHQEHKLHLAGLDDDQIAALDRDWDSLPSRTRVAVELARRMTLLPFASTDQQIENLRPEFDDRQIIELVYAISRFNSINRWSDSLGLPQDSIMRGEAVSFQTPTADRWNVGKSLAAPDDSILRPSGWSMQDIEAQWTKNRARTPRVGLPSESETRQRLGIPETQPVNDWQRATAELTGADAAMIQSLDSLLSDTELAPEIKAAAMWTSARYNHASVSLGLVAPTLKQCGWSQSELEALSNETGGLSNELETATAFAKKLTCTPHRITDEDIAALRVHWSDRQTAHLIYSICTANALDRFTETLGLSTRGLAATTREP